MFFLAVADCELAGTVRQAANNAIAIREFNSSPKKRGEAPPRDASQSTTGYWCRVPARNMGVHSPRPDWRRIRKATASPGFSELWMRLTSSTEFTA